MDKQRVLGIAAIGVAMMVAASVLGGQLAPPAGAVAPTPGPEPRITINQTNTPGDINNQFIISQPGSYYLTENAGGAFATGIRIDVGNVSIDLMGFELRGAQSGGSGIRTQGAGLHNIAIRNGIVSGWAQNGIDLAFSNEDNFGSRIENIHAHSNGTVGIRCGSSGIIRGCTATSNGSTGISAFDHSTIERCASRLNSGGGFNLRGGGVVRGCIAAENEFYGFRGDIGCTFENCSAKNNLGDGLFAGNAGVIAGCSTIGNVDTGIRTSSKSSVVGCAASGNGGSGISVGPGGVVVHNAATDNGIDGVHVVGDSLIMFNNCNRNGLSVAGAGIHAVFGDAGSRIDSNNVTENFIGIDVDTNSNFIVRNCAHGNTVNYEIAAGNSIGEIINVDDSTITTSNPWANFHY